MPKLFSFGSDSSPTTDDQVPMKDATTGANRIVTLANLITLFFSNIPSGTGSATGGIWWEELGRTTLVSPADTISVASISARKYIRVIFSTNATGGTNNIVLRFNNDSASNYNMRYSDNNGATSTTGATTGIACDVGAVAAVPFSGYVDVVNISAQEKAAIVHAMSTQAAGAATAPNSREAVAKWANTSAQITRVDAINSSGTGDFAIGSEVIVLGHN